MLTTQKQKCLLLNYIRRILESIFWMSQQKCVQFLRVFQWRYPLPVFTLASFHLLSLPASICQAVWQTYLGDFINLNPKKPLIMHGIDGNASGSMCIICPLRLSQPSMPYPVSVSPPTTKHPQIHEIISQLIRLMALAVPVQSTPPYLHICMSSSRSLELTGTRHTMTLPDLGFMLVTLVL